MALSEQEMDQFGHSEELLISTESVPSLGQH